MVAMSNRQKLETEGLDLQRYKVTQSTFTNTREHNLCQGIPYQLKWYELQVCVILARHTMKPREVVLQVGYLDLLSQNVHFIQKEDDRGIGEPG